MLLLYTTIFASFAADTIHCFKYVTVPDCTCNGEPLIDQYVILNAVFSVSALTSAIFSNRLCIFAYSFLQEKSKSRILVCSL